MVVLGWIILATLLILFLFGPPWYGNGCSFGYGYWDEAGPWLLCWVFAIVTTGLICLGVALVTGG